MSLAKWGGKLLGREALRLLLAGEVPGTIGVNAIVEQLRTAWSATTADLPDITAIEAPARPRGPAQVTSYPAIMLYASREQDAEGDGVPMQVVTVEFAIWVADAKLSGTISTTDAVALYGRALRQCIDQVARLPGDHRRTCLRHPTIPDVVRLATVRGIDYPAAAGDLNDHNAVALGEAEVLLLHRLEF